MSPQGTRKKRIGMLLRQHISEIMLRRMKDPRLNMVTVTDVEVSADLKLAKVFVCTSGGESDIRDKVRILKQAAPFVRGELARSMEIRYIPELEFLVDESLDRAARISKLLGDLARERREDPDGYH